MTNGSTNANITDADLFAYLDGSADSNLVERIEQSDAHQQRALMLAQEQAYLRAHLYRHNCPDTLELGEYFLGYLSRSRAAEIKAHLHQCMYCTHELVSHRKFLEETEPQATLWDKIKIFVAQQAPPFDTPGNLQPAFNMRGAEDSQPTIYTTEEGTQIALRVQEDIAQSGRKMLTGLATGPSISTMQVSIWMEGKHVRTVAIDQLGNFVLAGLEPGDYELILKDADLIIHIQTFTI